MLEYDTAVASGGDHYWPWPLLAPTPVPLPLSLLPAATPLCQQQQLCMRRRRRNLGGWVLICNWLHPHPHNQSKHHHCHHYHHNHNKLVTVLKKVWCFSFFLHVRPYCRYLYVQFEGSCIAEECFNMVHFRSEWGAMWLPIQKIRIYVYFIWERAVRTCLYSLFSYPLVVAVQGPEYCLTLYTWVFKMFFSISSTGFCLPLAVL